MARCAKFIGFHSRVNCGCSKRPGTQLVRDEPTSYLPHYRANTGRKRTYLQASFDPYDHGILTTVASTPAVDASDKLQAKQEVRVDVLPEPSRKRPRKDRQVGSEEQVGVDSSTAAIEDDGNDKPAVKTEKTKWALEKLKAKKRRNGPKVRYRICEERIMIVEPTTLQIEPLYPRRGA